MLDQHALTVPAMGGTLTLRVAHLPIHGEVATRAAVTHDLRRVTQRVQRWAARLTRFEDASDLMALNSDPTCATTSVPPTLAAALAWAERAADIAPDLVDVTLLDERLAIEEGLATDLVAPHRPRHAPRWHLVRQPRGGRVIRREPFRFDLDGVAKGWIADRALALLRAHPGALVDADGDIAMRLADDLTWDVAVADPRPDHGDPLAILRVDGRLAGGLVGVATSGTSVHRWPAAADGTPRHHLLDPRTRRPASTDVVQATVLMATARAAEVMAKAVVIGGSDAAQDLLDQPEVHGAVLLLDSGEVIATPRTLEWLA